MNEESQLVPADDEPFDLEREPLDAPGPGEHDWGGDGSDPLRPARAHVLEALRPNTAPYPPPVDALKQLGDPSEDGVAERRQALGLGQEHLQDLVRMARDRGLYTADSDTDEVWAPLHALMALDDLDISAVVSELIPLFDLDDDWHASELPNLLGKVGAPALEPLRTYLTDHTRWGYGHALIANALTQIAEQHPGLRGQVVAILSDVLRDAEDYSEDACTGAMDALVDLEAVEALPLIRHAFELGRIDELMRGSWGVVLDELGVEPEEDDPLLEESQRHFEERHEQLMPRQQREQLLEALERFKAQQRAPAVEPARPSQPAARVVQLAPPARASQPAPRDAHKAAQDKARKQKNKRKMEAASRKANRRKRK